MRGDPPLGVVSWYLVAPHQPLDLFFAVAKHNDNLVESSVAARLDHQGGVYDGDSPRISDFGLSKKPILFFDYPRVDDRIELPPLEFVGKHDRTELDTVNPAFRVEYIVTKLTDNLLESGAPRLHSKMSDLVGIERRASQFLEDRYHKAFADRYAACKSNSEH